MHGFELTMIKWGLFSSALASNKDIHCESE